MICDHISTLVSLSFLQATTLYCLVLECALGGDLMTFIRTQKQFCLPEERAHPHFFSTTHGARESGIREAERLENFYQKQLRH